MGRITTGYEKIDSILKLRRGGSLRRRCETEDRQDEF